MSRTSSLCWPSPDVLSAHPSLLSFQEPGLLYQRRASNTPNPPRSSRLFMRGGKTPFPLTSPQGHPRPHSPDTLPSEEQGSASSRAVPTLESAPVLPSSCTAPGQHRSRPLSGWTLGEHRWSCGEQKPWELGNS